VQPRSGRMIVFFPTYARRLPGERRWRATVAGMISRPLPPKSHRRTLAIGVIKRLLELDDAQLQSEVFQRRADAFLFQRVAGEPVTITLGERRIDAGQSDRVGHFQQSIDLAADDIEALAEGAGGACRWLTYGAALTGPADQVATDPRLALSAAGRIQLVEDEGMSVISDIDDTVKVTNVANRRELLANTLLREFSAVPGMAEIYRRWQEAGTAFHYVSASPWQLASCLSGFLRDTGLPSGSMHLKLFRLKDSTPLRRLPSRKRSKRRTIEQILGDFPRRKFLLVGDSGERDPEVYADVARRHPDHVAGVAIRLVEGKRSRDKERLRLDRLGRRVPGGRWHVFTEPAELGAAELGLAGLGSAGLGSAGLGG
jgi:phosphatidate phosphatase APP1